MSNNNPVAKPGEARCPIQPWAELVAADSRPLPQFLTDESYRFLGSEPLPSARYTDAAFFALEGKKMWPQVWQFAARDEDMPDPNDFVVYDNVGRSYLIVRQADGSVRAFYNVCRHRGRQLRSKSGSAREFRCNFHGWTYAVDGSIKKIPCRWDFPAVTDAAAHLSEVSVGRWGGYIFIREAGDGAALGEFLAPLPEFFKRWPHDDCFTVVNVGKIIHANWKATAEAFMETYHAPETHPQLTAFVGDVNAFYGMWGDNVNLDLTPFAVPSPLIDASNKSQQWIIDEYTKFNGRTEGTDVGCEVPTGQTARRALAAATRERYRAATGHDVEAISDAEMIDALTFNVFPNFSPWGGYMPRIVYRWRPWPDQRSTLMEVRILMPAAKGSKPLRGAPLHMLGEDEPWSAAKELGALGRVFDQDMSNLPFVQAGLEANPDGRIQLADYQEIRIRHFHRTLDKYLES
jgi:phenylpropionate dioxygenase-like ring-hydroxylating dioxygenase large terminal subunit